MTLANRITLFRLAFIPIFLALVYGYSPDREWMRWAALVLYTVGALSDIADGYIARHYGQSSKIGARLDPLADKLMINLGYVFVAANAHFDPGVPLWFPIVVLGRDLAIVMGAYTINRYFGPVKVQPRAIGKASTVFQNAALVAVLLQVALAYPLLIIALILTVASFLDYMYAGSRQALQQKAA